MLDNLNDVSVQNVANDFIEMRKSALHQDLSSAFMSGDEHQIQDKLREYEDFTQHVTIQQEDGNVFVEEDLETLLEDSNEDHLVKVYPKTLNERLGGGIPKPSHVLVFGRPESGKSALSINIASGFINQGHKTLYIGNEDNSRVMLLRFFTRLTGMTLEEVRGDPASAKQIAEEKGYGNLVFAALAPGTLAEIRALVEKHEPECLVVDQLRNLADKNDNKVERLEILAQGIRNMSNEYNLAAVSVTQAGDSADGKLILGMGDVDFSNTGIPGAVDVMIGIGVNEDTERQGFRFLSLPKNKIGGGDHNPVKVRLEPQYSRVTSV